MTERNTLAVRSRVERGFTLLEVLVALAILAIALAAAMRVAGLSATTSVEVKHRIAALWVAENRLVEQRLSNMWAAVGVNSGEVEQASYKYRWEETVNGTPNVNFRRIEIRVSAADQPDYVLADMVAYLPNKQ